MAQQKHRAPEFDRLTAPNTGSEARLAVRLRGGAGCMDSRPRGQRDRSGQRRAAIRDQGA